MINQAVHEFWTFGDNLIDFIKLLSFYNQVNHETKQGTNGRGLFFLSTWVAILHSNTRVLNSDVAALFISTQLLEITKEIPSGR